MFQPLGASTGADLKLESGSPDADSAHFFVAVCAAEKQSGGSSFLYLPASANVLRERERHIERLEGEVAQKTAWLTESQNKHQLLVMLHAEQKEKLEEANRWAGKSNAELAGKLAANEKLLRKLSVDAARARGGRERRCRWS